MKMEKLIAKIRNTRDYENLKERLGKELGTLIYQLVDEADKAKHLYQPPVVQQSELLICPCCGSNKTYRTEAIHCNRCAVTSEM